MSLSWGLAVTSSGTHTQIKKNLLRCHRVGIPSQGSVGCVSLNKPVKAPSNQAGLFSEGSSYPHTVRLVGHKGPGFPGALTDKQRTEELSYFHKSMILHCVWVLDWLWEITFTPFVFHAGSPDLPECTLYSFYGFRDFSLQYYICPPIHILLWNLELSQSIFCSYT